MIKIIKILLMTLILSPSFSFSFEYDRTLNDCFETTSQDLNLIKEKISDCVSEELERDTFNNHILKSAFKVDEVGKLGEATYNIYNNSIVFFMTIAAILGLFFLMSNNKSKIYKDRANYIIGAIIVSFLLLILSNKDNLDYTYDKALNNVLTEFFSYINTLNYLKDYSVISKNKIISDNRDEIFKKTDDITKAVINSQKCSITNYQNEIINYTKNSDVNDIISNDYLSCVDNFRTDNENKTISQLNNRLVFSAALKECSVAETSTLNIDCGQINTNSNITEINDITNKYAYQITKLFDEYLGVKCEKLRDFTAHRNICRTYKNGNFYNYSSDKEYFQIEKEFKDLSLSFTDEIAIELSKHITLTKGVSEIGLTDFSAQISKFIRNNDEDDSFIRINDMNKMLAGLTYINPVVVNRKSGRIIDQINDNVNDDDKAPAYFYYSARQDIDNIIANKSISLDYIYTENPFLKDPKLYFGAYTDATGKQDFEVSLNYDSNSKFLKNTLIAAKTFVVYKMSVDRSKFWHTANTIVNSLILIAYSDDFLEFTFIVFFVLFFIYKAFRYLLSTIIVLIFFFFKRNKPNHFIDELINFKITMLIIPAQLCFIFVANSIITAIILQCLEFIPFFNSSVSLNVLTIIVILSINAIMKIILAFYFFNFLTKILNAQQADQITTRMKGMIKKALTS